MDCCIKKGYQSGFTFVEIMVVVVIMGILSAAFISLGGMVREFRLGYMQQRLYNAVQLTKSEALTRSETHTICRSTGGTRCNDGLDWEEGWIVFSDPNGNRQRDSGEEVIRIFNNISSDYKITWSGDGWLSFDGRGFANHNFSYQFHGDFKRNM